MLELRTSITQTALVQTIGGRGVDIFHLSIIQSNPVVVRDPNYQIMQMDVWICVWMGVGPAISKRSCFVCAVACVGWSWSSAQFLVPLARGLELWCIG